MAKQTLIYLMDPHCGWCFGFHERAEAIFEKASGEFGLDVSVIPGGLFIPGKKIPPDFGEGKRPIGDRIQKIFGVSINPDYFGKVLASGWIDSEPSCRAVCASKHLADELKTVKLASALSTATFVNIRDISKTETVVEIAEEQGFSAKEFEAAMTSDVVNGELQRSLQFSQAAQTGFPSLFLVNDEKQSVTHLGGANLTVEDIERVLKEG